MWGTHLCNLCVDTRWFAHVLRDRPDDSHGAGGLLQVGGPVADALWLQRFGVALLTLRLVVGGKQKKDKKSQSVPERKLNITCLHRHVCTVQKHTLLSVCYRTPSPFLAQVPLFPAPSATTLERHLGGLACVLRTSPPGVGRGAPPRFVDCQVCLAPWAAQGPVSVTMVSRVCSVTMVALVACTPLALVASAQCGGIGSPGAVVPMCQVTLLASSPSLHHAYHGSLVTPSICFWTSPFVSPRTRVRDV